MKKFIAITLTILGIRAVIFGFAGNSDIPNFVYFTVGGTLLLISSFVWYYVFEERKGGKDG